MPATVSIALCTYNGQRFLELQLESLLAQTVKPDELVVCDDASSDRSVEIIEAFARRAPFPVRVWRNARNLGYVRNFEQAISHCTQDLVFLCDQDDLWDPHKIEILQGLFESEPAVGLCLHDFVRINAEGGHYENELELYGERQLRSVDLPEEIRHHSIRAFMAPYPRAWCGCMMAFRRDFAAVALPIYPGKGHDDWLLKVIAPLTEVRFHPSALVRYRIHTTNTNSQEVGHSAWSVFVRKLRRRLDNLRRGYSKKNFYRLVLDRIATSDRAVRRPELLEMYRRYT
ncbi:MAG: hypothetical protein RL522_2301 [Pseudomonadota bacterium]|jgi:glycosyltransferase involved in cell wall biosynthesis